jgi:cysteine-rich repeat protein
MHNDKLLFWTMAAILTSAQGCYESSELDDLGIEDDAEFRKKPAPVCGNGVLEKKEQCDDGNGVDDDACGNDCQINFYSAFGPQTDVDPKALIGWTVCYQDTYGTFANLSAIVAACEKPNLMLACRPTGQKRYTLLAHAPRAAVLTDTGTSNAPTVANGSGWYFNDNYSWGFAKEGDALDRFSCDIEFSTNPDLRLCWHTSQGEMTPGYRCGADAPLFEGDWERIVLHAG